MQTLDSTMAPKTERRRKLRKRPLSLVYVELPAANGGMMRDLSEEGFALRAMMPLRAGENTHFSFSLNELTTITGEGKILWVEEEGKVAGVRFTEVSPSAAGQIREWLLKDEQLSKRERAPARPLTPVASTMEELHEELRASPARPAPAETKERISVPASMVTSVPATPVSAVPPVPAKSVRSEPAAESPPIIPESGSAAQPVAIPPAESASAPVVTSVPPTPVSTVPPVPVNSVWSHLTVESPPSIPESGSETVTVPIPPVEKTTTLVRMALPTAPREPESVPSVPLAPVREEKKETARAVPDISTILLQPAMVRKISEPIELPSDLPVSEPLSLPEEARHHRHERRLDRFTLTTAIGIMLILALLATAFVYHREVGSAVIWLGEKIAGTNPQDDRKASIVEHQATPLPSQTEAAEGGATTAGTSRPKPSSEAPSQKPNNSIPSASLENMPQVTPAPATKSAPFPVTPLASSGAVAPSASTNQEIGQVEYQQALQILRGKNRETEMPEAVRLLWIAVEKGNPGAELALADLYWQGQGVVKNCDQTRILLSAAARKGNPEAQKRLKQFEQEGCE